MSVSYQNVGAESVSYFTPAQNPPSGTALGMKDEQSLPKIFEPVTIRGTQFQNRIFVSPMCQYSAQDGLLTPWHMAHLGGIFTRGPGLTIIEATAVVPEGRITPEDSGIWSDEHIESHRKIVEFAHSQNQKIAIQLAHAGRKASTVAPWLSFKALAAPEYGGWEDNVWAPSEIPYGPEFAKPHALTREGIKNLVKAFADAATRSVEAGYDVIEIHNAHGYLLHEFVSPVSNKRTDEYGGSFDNRIRFTLEVVDAVRAVIPEEMPLFLRISATDWLEDSTEPSWTVEQTVELAKVLAAHGVDFLDVSSGGNSSAQNIKITQPAYQAPLAQKVKQSQDALRVEGKASLLVGSVGGISTGELAEEVLKNEQADVILVGRQFQKDPGLVWTFADELGVNVKVANQIEWGFKGRGSISKAKKAQTSSAL